MVLERRPEPGGTWSVNRYPDIRVDTISITYEFNFEKDYRWSEYFGRGAEVREYLEHVSKKYGVYENTRFAHELKRATFDEDRDVWVLEVDTPDGIVTIEANAIVNARRHVRQPEVPAVRGSGVVRRARSCTRPAGPTTATPRASASASSATAPPACSSLAPIAEDAEQVYVFQRTPQWISPRDKYGQPVEPEVHWLLDNFPGYWNWWRYMAIAGAVPDPRLPRPRRGVAGPGRHCNPMNDKLREDLTAYIKAQTGGDQDLIDEAGPRLRAVLAPSGRRQRLVQGAHPRQRRARHRPDRAAHAEGHRDRATAPCTRSTSLVTATGFEVMKYLWPADYIGKDGVSIHDFWSKDGPRAYLSMMVPNFPNMFMLYGPNSQPLSGGTGLPIWYVIWSAYSARLLTRMLERGQVARRGQAKTPTSATTRRSTRRPRTLLLLQDEGAPDKNYYINEFGRMQVNAPWYGPEYHRLCTQVDWDDLELS